MSDSFAETKKSVQHFAVDAFKDHVLTVEGEGRWLCRRPERSEYWFRLITSTGAIIVFGDVGEMVLRFQSEPIEWLRGAVQSPDYLLSKVMASKEPPKQFYPQDALDWLREMSDGDDRNIYADAIETLKADYLDPITHHEFIECCDDKGIDDAYSVGMRYTASMLWMVELLKCFIRLHDAEKATAAA